MAEQKTEKYNLLSPAQQVIVDEGIKKLIPKLLAEDNLEAIHFRENSLEWKKKKREELAEKVAQENHHDVGPQAQKVLNDKRAGRLVATQIG